MGLDSVKFLNSRFEAWNKTSGICMTVIKESLISNLHDLIEKKFNPVDYKLHQLNLWSIFLVD